MIASYGFFLRDGSRCQYCSGAASVAEHVVPAALGGVASLHNLVAACASCNARKGRSVWIPANLDEITEDHAEWRALVVSMANGESRPAQQGETRESMLLDRWLKHTALAHFSRNDTASG
jgi:hypothetical protein